MTEREWMQEGIDLKLLFLLFMKKIWIVVLSVVAGASITTVIYMLTHVIYPPAREYRAQYKYYLEFNVDENGDVYQHYNDYTWNTIMKTDPIQGYTVEQLRDVPAETVADAVVVEPLSDIRLLVVTVTTTDKELTQRIADATEQSMIHFTEVMKEFKGVEVLQRDASALVVVELDTFRVAAAGAVAGLIFTVLAVLLYLALDDSIYIPLTFQKRYGYPLLGMTFAGEGTECAVSTEDKITYVIIKSIEEQDSIDYTALQRNHAIVLKVPYGARNGKLIEKQIAELLNHKLTILGAVVTGVDRKLYRAYYSAGKKTEK